MQTESHQRGGANTADPKRQASNDLNEVLSQLKQDHFYGSLELKFEAGVVVLLKKTETIKPNDQCHRDNRGETWPKQKRG